MGEQPGFARDCANLADPRCGAAVIEISDEFFAPAKRMLCADDPVFFPDRYDAHGKWMDGWESRRRRDAGHDHCVLRLCPGVIHGVDIDTRHFIGNYPAAAAVLACHASADPDAASAWEELVPRTELGPDRHHFIAVDSAAEWTHVRLHIFPDGGVARFRVYGHSTVPCATNDGWIDLAGRALGGRAVWCNDMHFGHMDNLIAPHAASSMADGWETRRRRSPGNDAVILQLAQPGVIRRIEVDTAWFRGNYPARVGFRAARLGAEKLQPEQSVRWAVLMDPLALGPDQLHVFARQLRAPGYVSHVRMDIYPDGGVSRLRLLGEPVA